MKADVAGARADQRHASADELALFVLDALEPAARRHLERHVAGCAACARALALEAAAEVALVQAWPGVARPLAPVLSLPVRPPVGAAAPPARPAPPAVRTPPAPATTRRLGAHRHALAASSWSNGLAAAVLTVLFVGYWNDGGGQGVRVTTHAHAGFTDGPLDDQALCPLDVFTPAPVLLASVDPDLRVSRMCTSPDQGDPAGLCQESTATCAR